MSSITPPPASNDDFDLDKLFREARARNKKIEKEQEEARRELESQDASLLSADDYVVEVDERKGTRTISTGTANSTYLARATRQR